MNRRGFLHPNTLAAAVGQAVGLADETRNLQAAAESETPALLRFARSAMATTFEVILPWGVLTPTVAASAALDEIDRIENLLTVYRESSEVSQLNRRAATVAVAVTAEVHGLIQLALDLNRQTEGAFDISLGALIKAWGFYKGPRRVPDAEERRAALEQCGMHHVRLETVLGKHLVKFLRPGLELNLGSIGKGYALDQAAAVLQNNWQVASALLHGGHSSVYAMGSEPGCENGWRVGIAHPWQAGRRLAVVRLRDRAIGTSAATFRHLEWQGRKLGHILDPRSGWPAEGMASASAIAANATQADALATAFYIQGVEKTRAYCRSHPGVGAILLPDGASQPVFLGDVVIDPDS